MSFGADVFWERVRSLATAMRGADDTMFPQYLAKLEKLIRSHEREEAYGVLLGTDFEGRDDDRDTAEIRSECQ